MFGWVARALAFLLLLACGAVSLGAAEGMRQYESDAYWAYAQSLTSKLLDDFTFLGDELIANFVSDAREDGMECAIYETCLHLDVFQMESCFISGELKYQLLDENESVIRALTVQMAPLPPREMTVIEIGTNLDLDFEYFELDTFTCKSKGLES